MEAVELKKTGATFARGKSEQDVGTPRVFLDAVERKFGALAWDLAAVAGNSVCGPCYIGPDQTKEDWRDSLAFDWAKLNGNLWLNPPFSNIAPWAAKCESVRHRLAWTLLLVPASVDANWYADHVHNKAFVTPLRGRLTFVGAKDPYPKGLILAAFGFGVSGFEPWRWRDGI